MQKQGPRVVEGRLLGALVVVELLAVRVVELHPVAEALAHRVLDLDELVVDVPEATVRPGEARVPAAVARTIRLPRRLRLNCTLLRQKNCLILWRGVSPAFDDINSRGESPMEGSKNERRLTKNV